MNHKEICKIYYRKNKNNIIKQHKEYRKSHRFIYSKYVKKWAIKNKNRLKKYHQKYYQKNKENIKRKRKLYTSTEKFKIHNLNYHRKYRTLKKYKLMVRKRLDNQKRLVYEHYSKSKNPVCKKCGFKDIRALSIDHINGKGAEHRRQVGKGNNMHRWLIKNNFPKGYQILCMNCQFIKSYENHEMSKRAIL